MAYTKSERESINKGKIFKWYEKLLCVLFGHDEFIPIVHFNDINDENSRVVWLSCKRCGLK